MNRRTFLKFTGLTTVAVLTTAGFSEPKQKWISFHDELPKPGQKIIIAAKDGMWIEGLTVVKCSLRNNPFDRRMTYTDIDFSKYIRKNKKASICAIYSDEGEKVLRTRKWCKFNGYDEYSDHKRIASNTMSVKDEKDAYLWLPVNGEYPQGLPYLPNYLCGEIS